jgi:hypothetical protein
LVLAITSDVDSCDRIHALKGITTRFRRALL